MAKCMHCFHYDNLKRICNIIDNGCLDPTVERECGNYVETCYTNNTISDNKIRQFESGATRNTNTKKLSYVKGLSPTVLKRYLTYLDKHRLQSDGNMREFDNWKKGIPKDVYLDSLGRHFIAAWMLQEGIQLFEDEEEITLEDTLCAVIFNSMGWLYELLKEKK